MREGRRPVGAPTLADRLKALAKVAGAGRAGAPPPLTDRMCNARVYPLSHRSYSAM